MLEGFSGNSREWKQDLFPEEFIPNILELVISSWAIFRKPDRLALEVPISKEFVKIIRANKNQSEDLPFHVWYELPTINTQSDDGRVDIFLHI